MKLLSVVFAFLLATVTLRAGEYRIVYQHQAPEYLNYTCLDPVVDSNRQLAGFVFSEKVDSQLVVALFGREPLVVGGLPAVATKTINRQVGDSLIIFACGYPWYHDYEDVMYLGQIVVCSSVVSAAYVHPPMPDYGPLYLGDYLICDNPDIAFIRRTDSGVELAYRYSDMLHEHIPGGYGWNEWSGHHTQLFSTDLQPIGTLREAYFLHFADLYANPGLEQALCQMSSGSHHISTPDEFEWSAWASLYTGVLDSAGEVMSYRRTSEGSALALFTGDFDQSQPYDELIFCGLSGHLSDPPGDTSRFVACYSYATGQPEELWYHQFSGTSLDYLTSDGKYMVGWLPENKVGVYSTASGECIDTIRFDRPVTAWRFFDTGDPATLNLVARNQDTVFVYQFDSPTAVADGSNEVLPQSFTLHQNYPNPFNNETVISFSNSTRQHLTLNVYNSLGQVVKTLYDAESGSGEIRVSWDGRNAQSETVASGVYFARLRSAEGAREIKMMLVK